MQSPWWYDMTFYTLTASLTGTKLTTFLHDLRTWLVQNGEKIQQDADKRIDIVQERRMCKHDKLDRGVPQFFAPDRMFDSMVH